MHSRIDANGLLDGFKLAPSLCDEQATGGHGPCALIGLAVVAAGRPPPRSPCVGPEVRRRRAV